MWQKQISKIEYFKEVSNSFYQDLLGYKPEQTLLQQIPESQWNEFAIQRGLNPNSLGIYLPRNQTAIIQGENSLSLFHEYFGHGLYCEQSVEGRKLIDLEKRLLEEEKQEFSSVKFTLEDLQRFRKQNPVCQELENFKQENLGRYELFAIWTEYLLSEELSLKNSFERKYDSLQNRDKEAINSIIDFSKQYGNLATFYARGLARRITLKRVKSLLQYVYKDKLQDVRFAMLYGSKKEFSDIDIFIVSDALPRIRNEWIDVLVYPQNEFKKKVELFDVEITDPLFTGEFIFGDKNYVEIQKQKLKEQIITEDAIKHNLRESKEQEKSAYNFPQDSEWRKIGLSYASTFKLMAENLKKGIRVFTKSGLLSAVFHSTNGI